MFIGEDNPSSAPLSQGGNQLNEPSYEAELGEGMYLTVLVIGHCKVNDYKYGLSLSKTW